MSDRDEYIYIQRVRRETRERGKGDLRKDEDEDEIRAKRQFDTDLKKRNETNNLVQHQ